MLASSVGGKCHHYPNEVLVSSCKAINDIVKSSLIFVKYQPQRRPSWWNRVFKVV